MKHPFWDRILMLITAAVSIAAAAGLVMLILGKFSLSQVTDLLGKIDFSRDIVKAIAGAAAAVCALFGVFMLSMMTPPRKKKSSNFAIQRNENGMVRISLKALETLVAKVLNQHAELKVVTSSLYSDEESIRVDVHIALQSDISMPLAISSLQKQIKRYIEACSGVQVSEVRIFVDSTLPSDENAAKSPYAIPEALLKGTGDALAEGHPEEEQTPSPKPQPVPEKTPEPAPEPASAPVKEARQSDFMREAYAPAPQPEPEEEPVPAASPEEGEAAEPAPAEAMTPKETEAEPEAQIPGQEEEPKEPEGIEPEDEPEEDPWPRDAADPDEEFAPEAEPAPEPETGTPQAPAKPAAQAATEEAEEMMEETDEAEETEQIEETEQAEETNDEEAEEATLTQTGSAFGGSYEKPRAAGGSAFGMNPEEAGEAL